jgi:diguanylate cyclase (GGDEF)-like protein
VLVVARDMDIRRRIASVLGSGVAAFDVEEVPDASTAVDRLAEGAVDVAIVRPQPPDGLAAVRRVHSAAPDIPIVALLATGGPEGNDAALAAGASDSMSEDPLDAEIMRRTLRYATERARLQVEARRGAVLDGATGVYNARGFEQLAAHHLVLAERSKESVVVVLVRIAPASEPGTTEALIHDTAEVLRDAVRDADVVGRLGGETFGVLLSGDASGNEGLVLARIVEAVATRNARAGATGRLILAIGSATSDADHRLSAPELIRAADARMHMTTGDLPG